MIEQFTSLSREEIELVKDAPALITLLIASSDKGLDQKEMDHALHIMKWKKFHARPDLEDYYREVSSEFNIRLNNIIKDLPKNDQERRKILEDQLSGLNNVLPRFDREFAEQLYKSYLELARGVAESSGGLLGYLSVNMAESKLVKLPMIDDPRTYNI